MTVHWPRALLKPRKCDPNVAPASVAGPVSLSGYRQSVTSPAGVWSIRYDTVVVASVAQRLTWRALAAQILGRTTPVVVPVYDRRELTPVIDGAGGLSPHSDGATHSDGSMYVTAGASVVVNGVVARGAVAMRLTVITGAAIQAGMHFSIGQRLYRVASITSSASGGTDVRLRFWPPAREGIIDGAEVDFAAPVCKCRLDSAAGLDLDLDHGRHGFPSITWIEDPG